MMGSGKYNLTALVWFYECAFNEMGHFEFSTTISIIGNLKYLHINEEYISLIK